MQVKKIQLVIFLAVASLNSVLVSELLESGGGGGC